MGRRIGVVRIALMAGAALALLALAACEGQFDLLEAIKTEVKLANNKFLQVLSVDPAENDAAVKQSKRIAIQFDRSLDTSTIRAENVTFDPPFTKPWKYIYNDTTKILYIYPDPYFTANTPYTVTIGGGLKGAAGEELPGPYSWAFETGESATGTFFIETDQDLEGVYDYTAEDLYTRSLSVKLYLYDFNVKAYQVKAASSAAAVVGPGSWTLISGLPDEGIWKTMNYTLADADGTQSVYVGFAELAELPLEEEIRFDSIIVDRVGPNVTASNRTFNAATVYPAAVYATASDALSGISSYSWTGPAGIVFSNSTIEDALIASVPAGVDTTYALSLTATDGAGNPNTGGMTLTVDDIPPLAPVMGAKIAKPAAVPGFVSLDGSFWWTWKPDPGETDSVGYFAYKAPGMKDFEKIKGTAYPPKDPFQARDYGPYTLELIQYDNASNPSPTVALTVYYSPADIRPYWGQEDLASSVVFQWPKYPYANSYDLYYGPAGLRPKLVTVKEPTYSVTLKTGFTWQWYYIPKDKAGRALAIIPGKEQAYSFTTAR